VDATWRERVLRELLGAQESSGMYAYPVHPNGTAHDDLSNTLYAALALRAAPGGLEVPEKTWRLVDGTPAATTPTATAPGATIRDGLSGFSYRPTAAPPAR
jgi:hypothetical protein